MKSYRRKDQIWKQAMSIEKDAEDGKLPMLSEMAIPLKSFLAQADGLGWQIAINWCLCKWCQLYDSQCINFNHWKDELAAHLSHLNRLNIKNGIDKRKHLNKIWIQNYDFNDKNTILKVIANKFYKEHIDDKHQCNVVASAFANSIDEIINVVSNDVNETMQYVEKTFNVE